MALSIVNPRPQFLEGPQYLHHLLSRHIGSDDVAIEHTDVNGHQSSITYKQLHGHANALAATLISSKPHNSDNQFIVPLFIPQSLELYISQLAILKAGGAFCPIPLDVPEDRLRFILGDVEATLLLTSTSLAKQLPSLEGVEVVTVDNVTATIQNAASEIPLEPSQPAYVMYTSGSTGKPKGVLLSHSAASQALLAHDRHIPPFQRFLQFANPTFDVSVFEIFFPFFRGATLVTCDRKNLLNDLPGVINRLKVDAAELTPSVASSLLHDRASVPSLKVLLTIGEMLKKSVVEEFGGNISQTAILHGMYGPTEATIHCTLQPLFQTTMSVGNIGVPLDTTSAFVVKPASETDPYAVPEILPVGDEGELAVGGYQLADGYIKREEQTKAAFVHHPDHGRLYRTGDRAKLMPDGTLECLGRISSGQVKLRGQRIELGEIEHAASQTQGCRTVVADVLDGALVVFCVLNDPSTTTDDIRKSCRKWLPAFMVPNDTIILDALPYLSSGKVDRRALKAHYTDIKSDSGETAELSAKGQKIAYVLSSVLKSQVSGKTALAAVGLDSLSAIRIASAMRNSGLPQLDAATILEARTLSEIEDALEDDAAFENHQADLIRTHLQEEALSYPALSTHRKDIEEVYETTAVQSAMLAETVRESKAYCNWVKLRIKSDQNLKAIETALHQLALQHSMLRTGFVTLKSGFINVVWKALCKSQLQRVSRFEHNLAMQTEEDFLRPCHFQLLRQGSDIQLLVQLHHALYDQWTLDIFKRDLELLLQGNEIETAPSFSRVSAHHGQVLRSHRDVLSDFWQQQLRDYTPTLIPQLNGRKTTKALSRTPWTPLDGDLEALREQAKLKGYSVPALFQAAYACLLGLYAGSQDVLFGTVFSGRNIPVHGVDNIVGPCLTTLPSRLDLSSAHTAADLVRSVHDSNRQLQKHALLPLAEIKAAAQCSPGAALIDSLFIWQESTIPTAADPLVQEVDSEDRTEFNLVLEFEPKGTKVLARATYQQQLLPQRHVELLFAQVEGVVQAMIQQPDQAVGDLISGISQQASSICNPSPSHCSPQAGVVAEIERQAETHPDSFAVEFATSLDQMPVTDRITYSALNERANRLAHYLQSAGVNPNDVVGVWMEKSINLYVAMLAILKAGAGYLPLLPETPGARVKSAFSQAQVRHCIADTGLRIDLPVQMIIVRQDELERYSPSNLHLPYVPSNVAYAVFTSGSTGEPKGVAVTFENLSGNIGSLAELYKVRSRDRLLQACSQAFDVSVFEIFFALSTGMCLCSAKKEVLFRDLEHSIRSLEITHLSMTPTVAALVDPKNIPTVRFLVTAGEPLTDTVQKKWAGRGLHQGYGPSETTNICSVHMDFPANHWLGDLGPPLRNTSVFVISASDRFQILPKGALGELAFGGEQVFRGYIGRDDLNSVKLLEHPQYGRLYRSGDMARMLHDGSMFFSGRQDDQVKVRGNRIELGEISATILRDEKIVDCTTAVYGEENSGQSIVSSVVLDQGRNESQTSIFEAERSEIDRLFKRLEESLPAYMVPSMLIPMTSMPLTTQGKLDRRVLKTLIDRLSDQQRARFSRDHEDEDVSGEWSDAERRIAVAFARTLETPIENVKRATSFYAYGLNSLNAIALSRALEDDGFQKRVNVDVIFRNPSIKRLATAVMEDSSAASKTTTRTLAVFDAAFVEQVKKNVESNGRTLEQILPCTPLQDAMLAVGAGSIGSAAYSNSTTFAIAGDVTRMRSVWQRLVQRHAILRTHFVPTDSTTHPFAQVIVADKEVPWNESEPQVLGKDDATIQQPFRIMIYSHGNETFLELRMHHAIYDGNSMSILLNEAQALYRDEALEPTPSFEVFISEANAQQSEGALAFWKKQFFDFQPKPFPRSESSSPVVEDTFRGLLAASATNVEAFCKRHAVTPLSVFQAAWVKTLASSQDFDDLCFGNVISGRLAAVPGIQRLVAPCFNTVPIRVRLGNINTNLSLIRSLHQQNIDSMECQLTALRRIQGLSRAPQHHLFDSMLLLQPQQEQLDASIWKFAGETGAMDLPLVVEVVPQSSNYAVHVHHTTAKVSQALVKSLTNAFIAAVSSCIRYSSSSVSDLLGFDSKEISGKLAPMLGDLDDMKSAHRNDDPSDSWSTVESTVRDVFAHLGKADVNKIGKQTSMYRLGLDSLNAAQIAAHLRTKGLQIDAAGVIQDPTPSGIANTINTATTAPAGERVELDFKTFETEQQTKLGIAADGIEAIRPCTAVQCGMIAQSLDSRGSLYVNHVTFSMQRRITKDQLEEAWRSVQQKHQALRMGFFHIGGQQPFAMAIYGRTNAEVNISEHNRSLSETDLESHAAAAIVDNLIRPAWRVTIGKENGASIMTLSLHHALYDADSLQVVLRDFQAVLNGESIGESVGVDSLLASILQSSSSTEDHAKPFWQKTLEGSNFIKFPDLAPGVVRNVTMLSTVRSASADKHALDNHCKSHGVSTQAVGQTAWAQLLAAYTGEAQVLFGIVLSARSSPEDQEIVFPSITTIPVSCDTSKDTPEIVQEMIQYNASAQRFRFTPLSDIQRYAERAGQSLFDTVFVYQKTSTAQFSWDLVRETAAVDYAVSLELEIAQDGSIQFRLTFKDDQVPVEHAEMILQQYDHLFSQIIQFRSAEEGSNQALYSVTPAKEPKLPSPVTLLHEFLERGAEKHPGKLAFEFVDDIHGSEVTSRKWSYKQVDERSNQVAQLLQKHGVKKGSIVAVCMEKSPEVAFAFEGILKAGCSYLAMDPELPAARHKFILEDSASALLFSSPGRDMSEVANGVPVLQLTESLLNKFPCTKVNVGHIDPSETSYNLYTSGTTGTPKGCQLSHQNALQFLVWFQRLFSGHWDENSRWCQFASYWFDVSMLEHFWSWGVGIACVGAPRDLMLEDIGHFIRTANITHIDLTPSLARLLTPNDVPSLVGHVFITGGEALKQEIIDAWGPVHTICNGYGPTETSCGVTMLPFVGTDAKPSNIGPQFDNVGTYVLKPESEEPVLRGAVGELCISGVLVGKGYLNRPEQTAKAFPTLKSSGERIYRTGDLVRVLHDGSFSFIGRKDTQAKLRGQRLEIGEIDSVIKDSSSDIVEVTSLVAKSGDGGRETLVSFISTGIGRKNKELVLVHTDTAKTLVRTADEACRNHLPPYMVPTHVLPMTFMPLTVNNKVDSKKLVALYKSLSVKELQQLKGSDSATGPLNNTEKEISQALTAMLQLDSAVVSRETNVFSLGLSSVSAISLANTLKQAGFKDASVNNIMKNATIKRIAQSLSVQESQNDADDYTVRQAQLSIAAFSQRWRRVAANKLGIAAGSIQSISPCTPLQEGLILDSMRKTERPYFNEFRYLLKDATTDGLHAAFKDLVSAVELLRTAIIETDDGYAQVVKKTSKVQWAMVKDDEAVERLKTQWLENNTQDLLQPLQVVIQETSKTLIFHVHHSIYDGISWQLMLAHLAQMYQQGSKAADIGPPFSKALPYGPLSSSQEAKSFWESRLSTSLNGELEPMGTKPSTKDTVASVTIRDTSKLEHTRKTIGVSHQALLQACFEIAIHQQSSKTTLYGQVVSGRSIPLNGADKVIGPLFNTIPVPMEIDAGDTWTDLVRRLQDANVSSIPYHHTPLRNIRKWLRISPSDPLFDVLFVFQHETTPSTDKLWEPVDSPLIADYPLAFELTLHDNGHMTATVVAESQMADEEAVRTLLQDFQRALRAVVEDPASKVVENFTITAQTKVNRSDRNSHDPALLNGVHDFEWTKDARTIRQAIAQLAGLDVEEVDEHSTIFSLGLDSIDAVKLGARLKKAHLPIPVSKIIQAQTVPRLMGAVEASTRSNAETRGTRILQDMEQKLTEFVYSVLSDQMNIEKVLPATPNQEALIADMIRSDFADYYNHDVLKLDRGTDEKKLTSAWQKVIDESPILRTGFLEVDDPDIDATFVQVVHAPSKVEVNHVTVSDLNALDHVQESIKEDVRARSHTAPCPLRLTLVTTREERYLLISISHAQYDGHSLALIHEDVQRAYCGTHKARPGYDSIIEDALEGTNEEAKSFWTNLLSGTKKSIFPTLETKEKHDTVNRAEKVATIPLEQAKAFCQKNGCSLQALAQTCWALVLAHYSKSLEVAFGSVQACRDSEEAEQVLFPTMNTVAMRVSLHGSKVEMLQHMQSTINEMLPYQRTPLRTIQAAAGISDMFNTLFIYQHRPEVQENAAKPLYESVRGSSSVEYPVASEMEATGGKIVFRTACKASTLDANGANKLLNRMDEVLTSILSASSESTLAFSSTGTSICGLPAIQLEDEVQVNGVDHEDDLSTVEELSPTAGIIRFALAKVAKIAEDSITPNATIESIGIDSISTIKVVGLLRKKGISLSVSQMIKARTVVKMAEMASTEDDPSGRSEVSSIDMVAAIVKQQKLDTAVESIDRVKIEKILPATAGQVYMMNVWQKTEGQLFHPTFNYHLDASVSTTKVEQAWNKLTRHHPLLRTVLLPTQNRDFPMVQAVLKDNTTSSFTRQSSSTPQSMVGLQVQKSDDGHLLKLTIHHALYDAISLPLILQDFGKILNDNALQQIEHRQEDFLALSVSPEAQSKAKRFWSSYLATVKPIKLRQPEKMGAQPRVELFNPALSDQVGKIENLAKREGVTFHSLLFAVYAKVYARLAGQEGNDVILGIYLSNRSHLPELSTLASPTLNLVPLLVRSPGSKTVVDVAKQIHVDLNAINTPENSAVGLWQIREWTGIVVDTFINLIKVPEIDGTASETSGVALEEVDEYRTQPYTRVSQPGSDSRPVRKDANAQFNDVYQFSLDLEATVSNKGALDIGLFCPEEMLSLPRAKELVSELKDLFESII